jgi:hypothetical protein
MNTRSPLDASLSPKASPLVPQVKTASLAAIGKHLQSGMLENPLLSAGAAATLMGLANRYAPTAVGNAVRRAPQAALLAPAVPFGSAGVMGAYGGRYLAGAPSALGAVGAGTAAGMLGGGPIASGLAAAAGAAASRLGTNQATRDAVTKSFASGGASRKALQATSKYLARPTDTSAALRTALLSGGSLGGLKYLTSGVASSLTPSQIAIASGAAGLGRYLAPSIRPHASTYLRRRRELQALERLEKVRAADPREQIKKFLFGAPKEGSYGTSALAPPLTKTAGSLLEYPGMDKEAIFGTLALGGAALAGGAAGAKAFSAGARKLVAPLTGRLEQGARFVSRKAGQGLLGRSTQRASKTTDFMQTPGMAEFKQLSPLERGKHIVGLDANRATGRLGRVLQYPGRLVDRIKARHYANVGEERQLELAQRMAQGRMGAQAQLRQKGLGTNQGVQSALSQRQYARPAPYNPAQNQGVFSQPIIVGNSRAQGQAGRSVNFSNYTPAAQQSAYRQMDDAVATAMNVRQATGDMAVGSLARHLRTNPEFQNAITNNGRLGIQDQGALANSERLAREMLTRRAAEAGHRSIDDYLVSLRQYSRQTRSGGSADTALRGVAQQARVDAGQQLAGGAGTYQAASRQMDAAMNAGAGRLAKLDHVGLPARTNLVNTSQRIKDFDKLDDFAGMASREAISDAQIAARAAMSNQINTVNREISSDIGQAVNNITGTNVGGQVQSAIERSGALRSVEEAIANGTGAVNKQQLIAELEGLGINNAAAQRVATQVEGKLNKLVVQASNNVDEGLQAARSRLSQQAGKELGDRVTSSIDDVNRQLTAQIDRIGGDTGALAQKNMELLQEGLPTGAAGQNAALGLIDDLRNGLATGKGRAAVDEFNAQVNTLRQGGEVFYSTTTRNAAGTLVRTEGRIIDPTTGNLVNNTGATGVGKIKLDPSDLGTMNRIYRESRGVTPESIADLRRMATKNPVELLDDSDIFGALSAQVGADGIALIKGGGDAVGKLLSGNAGSLKPLEKARLLMADPNAFASMAPQMRGQVQAAVQSGKLTGNPAQKDALATAIDNALNQSVPYTKLRDMDLGAVIEQGVGSNLAFKAFKETGTPAQLSRLRRFMLGGVAPGTAQAARGRPSGTGALATAGVAGATALAGGRRSTASYGSSPLAAPVKVASFKSAVALYEEDLGDQGNSPLKPPVFQPPRPKFENKALLSSGALGVDTAVKSGSYTTAPVVQNYEKRSFLSPPMAYS